LIPQFYQSFYILHHCQTSHAIAITRLTYRPTRGDGSIPRIKYHSREVLLMSPPLGVYLLIRINTLLTEELDLRGCLSKEMLAVEELRAPSPALMCYK
jgi:hypothetical protein